jgi:hypothetical protein
VTGHPCVQGIDGSSMSVVATGSMDAQDRFGRVLLLCNVLFVQDLKVIVISASKLSETGLKGILAAGNFQVENCVERRLFEATVNGLFCTTCVIRPVHSKESPLPRMHRAPQCFTVSF